MPQVVPKVVDQNLEVMLSVKTKTLKQKWDNQKCLTLGVEGAIELKLKADIDELLDNKPIYYMMSLRAAELYLNNIRFTEKLFPTNNQK